MSSSSLKERSSIRLQYFILISVIIAAGLSQGLFLPVLSIFLENMGVSSSLNGLNAAALYIGSFGMTLIAERVLGRIGFKKLMAAGLSLVLVTLMLFPLIPDVRLWFLLRLAVGIGDSAVNYAAQLWVLLMTPAEHRGRNISFYGMSYGLGFSIGPLGIKLLDYGELVPFAVLSVLFVMVLLLVLWKLPDSRPLKQEGEEKRGGRFRFSYTWAWYALLPALLYGYMEASLNSNFPVYGLRIGMDSGKISTLLLCVGLGGLLLQMPLGLLSDRLGRKKILMFTGIAGGLMFMLVPLAGTQFGWNLLLLTAAGGLVGSFFSLGLAYAADILPKSLLASANVIASFHFSLGSIIGPNIGGAVLDFGPMGGMFWLLGGSYAVFGLLGVLFRRSAAKDVVSTMY